MSKNSFLIDMLTSKMGLEVAEAEAFITAMVKVVNEGLKEDKQKRCIMLFFKAANAHPQFKIVEEATAEDSISTGENLIPFPLNTDWEKAYEEVQEKLKSKSAK